MKYKVTNASVSGKGRVTLTLPVSKVSYNYYDGTVKGQTYPVAKASGEPLNITDDINH